MLNSSFGVWGYVGVGVCVCVGRCVGVCVAMHFVVLKLGMGIDGPKAQEHIFDVTHQSSKIFQRSICRKNVSYLQNLVRRNPNPNVVHCRGQRSCRGVTQVKLLSNTLWPPNLVRRTPD